MKDESSNYIQMKKKIPFAVLVDGLSVVLALLSKLGTRFD